jgi:hypothetical protein
MQRWLYCTVRPALSSPNPQPIKTWIFKDRFLELQILYVSMHHAERINSSIVWKVYSGTLLYSKKRQFQRNWGLAINSPFRPLFLVRGWTAGSWGEPRAFLESWSQLSNDAKMSPQPDYYFSIVASIVHGRTRPLHRCNTLKSKWLI